MKITRRKSGNQIVPRLRLTLEEVVPGRPCTARYAAAGACQPHCTVQAAPQMAARPQHTLCVPGPPLCEAGGHTRTAAEQRNERRGATPHIWEIKGNGREANDEHVGQSSKQLIRRKGPKQRVRPLQSHPEHSRDLGVPNGLHLVHLKAVRNMVHHPSVSAG